MDSEENNSESSSNNKEDDSIEKSPGNNINNESKESNPFQKEKNTSLFKGPSLFGSKDISPISKVNYYTPQIRPLEKDPKNENIITKKENLNQINIPNKESQNKLFFNDEINKNTGLPKLQNIVSTANLKCVLDLREIALKAKNAEYNPSRFAAVIMRIKEPKTTALIFSSGKMVCTGARNEEESKQASRTYAKIILK